MNHHLLLSSVATAGLLALWIRDALTDPQILAQPPVAVSLLLGTAVVLLYREARHGS